jgi:FAD:protein FMN transferase
MIARARALLGTLVSIRADTDEIGLRRAFAAVETVHGLMSAHSDGGDLAAINLHAHRRAVRVHPWTYRVLRSARAISRASQGAFDPTLGRRASWADIQLLPRNEVKLARLARLDLGGIAKGFAVDLAVAALRREGATIGCVNAGGDLRFFGRRAQLVRVRVPASPTQAVPLAETTERAFATSGTYFGGEIVDARDQSPLCAGHSVTVSAGSCMVADALTKAVAAIGPQRALLRRFGAQAFLVDGHGTLYAPRR